MIVAKDSYLFRDLRQAARDARGPDAPRPGTTLPRLMIAPLTAGAGSRTVMLALAAYLAESESPPTLFTSDADPARARYYRYLLSDHQASELHPLPSWLIPGSMARFLLNKHAGGSRWSLIELPGGLFSSRNLQQPDSVLESLNQRFKQPEVLSWPGVEGETPAPGGSADSLAQTHRTDHTEASDDPDTTDSPLTGALPTGAPASLALDLACPLILIVDVHNWGLSSLTALRGLTDLVPGLRPAGLILNRVPLSQFGVWPSLFYKATGLPVLMTIPELPLAPWPELSDYTDGAGHMTALMGGKRDAKDTTAHNLKLLTGALRNHNQLSVKTLLRFADEAPQLQTTIPASLLRAQRVVASLRETTSYPFRLAVAQDEAFADYYRDNLDLFKELGGEIVPFSPLNDNSLPADIDGLILGGGPVEAHIEALSRRTNIIEEIRELAADGLPIIAEGEGYIFASEGYTAGDEYYPLLALVPGQTAKAQAGDDFRSQTGLLRMVSRGYDLRAGHGEVLRIYDDHHFRVGKQGQAYRASIPGGKAFLTGHGSPQLSCITGHHFAFGSPRAAANFAKLCFERHRERTGEEQGKLQGWKL